MQTKDHLGIALFLLQGNLRLEVKRYSRAFIIGNILPDLNCFTYIAGHTFTASWKFVQRKIEKLLCKNKWNVFDVCKFGELIHYAADYFTYAHNESFCGDFKAHNAYEEELHLVFKEYVKGYSNNKSNVEAQVDCINFVEERHFEYMRRKRTLKEECDYILLVCSILFNSICETETAKEADTPREVWMPQESCPNPLSIL